MHFTHDDRHVLTSGADGAIFQWRHHRFGQEPDAQAARADPPGRAPVAGRVTVPGGVAAPRRFEAGGVVAKRDDAVRPKRLVPPPSRSQV